MRGDLSLFKLTHHRAVIDRRETMALATRFSINVALPGLFWGFAAVNLCNEPN